MALKFLNKKGWHTGSLRNIENVWKAEQKHDAEQKKLDEIRKQIQEERERSEFRLLQERAGLVPQQERLEFLYDSGLAVGRSSSDGFKALETLPKTEPQAAPSSSSQQQQPSVPGALFEEKPQSANDAWRKLHTDPLLLIRQQEQEALARIKNNPIQMAMIRKSVDEKKQKKSSDEKKIKERHRHKKSKHKKHSSSDHEFDSEDEKPRKGRRSQNEEKETSTIHKSSGYDKHSKKAAQASEGKFHKIDIGRKKSFDKDWKMKDKPATGLSKLTTKQDDSRDRVERSQDKSWHERRNPEDPMNSESSRKEWAHSQYRRRDMPVKLSEEERAAKLREMQGDAELHEEQRWKRLRKADEDDAREAIHGRTSGGKNFLHASQESVYGVKKGGSSTIEESVRRRTYYSQGRSEVGEGSAFRR